MRRNRAGWLPALTRIKTGRGRARVPLGNGQNRDFYFGNQGDWPEHEKDAPESILRPYEALMAEFLAGRLVVPQAQGEAPSCGDVCRSYFTAMRGRHVREGGMLAVALRPVHTLFEQLPATSFDARAFDRCRAWHLKRGVAPRTAQWYGALIKTCFRWAARPERKMVPASVVAELSLVSPLVDEGETPIEAAPEQHVLAAAKAACPRTRTMLLLQLLTGMRPGEVCQVRREDIDTAAGPECWLFRPSVYKTRRSALVRRSGGRKVWLGPLARNLLADWLMRRPVEGYCFRSNRHRRVDTRCYRDSVHAACLAAGVPRFDPRQVRHTTLTRLEVAFGSLDHAQAVAGHTKPDMTRRYAHGQQRLAAEAMRRLG